MLRAVSVRASSLRLPLLALGLIAGLAGVSAEARGATFERAAYVRTSLDGDGDAAAATPPSPRRIRRSLDDAAPPPAEPATVTPNAPLPGNGVARRIQPAPSRRLFRLTLDGERPTFAGRLIRVSLDDTEIVYARLDDAMPLGRHVRISLD
jgi:hypothetical protein